MSEHRGEGLSTGWRLNMPPIDRFVVAPDVPQEMRDARAGDTNGTRCPGVQCPYPEIRFRRPRRFIVAYQIQSWQDLQINEAPTGHYPADAPSHER
jgi:hypothetical protein